MSDPVVTRLPEALEAEAEQVKEAEAVAAKAAEEAEKVRVEAALSETDQERLLREQAEGR